MLNLRWTIPSLLLVIVPCVAPAQVAPADSAHLVAITQLLLDAYTDGDTAAWARQLAPTWLLADEEGQVITRPAFLSSLHPLPPGQQGKLTLSRWRITGGQNVAVITYDADEEHHYYGQLLLTRFHATDTYIRSRGRWWQIAAQVTALPRPIAGVPLSPRLAREYAGTYGLTAELQLTIVASDSGLVLQRTGRDPQRLYALDDRLFIRHGVRGFWVFERDTAGTISRLVNWRDNNPVVWRRL